MQWARIQYSQMRLDAWQMYDSKAAVYLLCSTYPLGSEATRMHALQHCPRHSKVPDSYLLYAFCTKHTVALCTRSWDQ